LTTDSTHVTGSYTVNAIGTWRRT